MKMQGYNGSQNWDTSFAVQVTTTPAHPARATLKYGPTNENKPNENATLTVWATLRRHLDFEIELSVERYTKPCHTWYTRVQLGYTRVQLVYCSCTTRVLLVYYSCTTSVLLVYYSCTTRVLLGYYSGTTRVLHVYYSCTTRVLVVY